MSGKMGGGGPPEQGVGESCLPECPSPLSLPDGEPIVPWLPVSGQEAEMTETVDDFVQEPQANLASARSPGTANQGTPGLALVGGGEVLVWKQLPLRALSDPRQSHGTWGHWTNQHVQLGPAAWLWASPRPPQPGFSCRKPPPQGLHGQQEEDTSHGTSGFSLHRSRSL